MVAAVVSAFMFPQTRAKGMSALSIVMKRKGAPLTGAASKLTRLIASACHRQTTRRTLFRLGEARHAEN